MEIKCSVNILTFLTIQCVWWFHTVQSESEIGLLHIQGMCLGILVCNSHNKHGKRKEKKQVLQKLRIQHVK